MTELPPRYSSALTYLVVVVGFDVLMIYLGSELLAYAAGTPRVGIEGALGLTALKFGLLPKKTGSR